jgi:hypothetical protein
MKMKHLLWGGLALAVLFAGTSTAKAAIAAQNLDYKLHPRFAGLDSTGLHLDLDASFENDTSGTVAVRDTIVEVFHGDSLLAKVDTSGKSITIKPRSKARLSDPDQLGEPIRLHIPYSVIQKYAPEAISAFLGFGPPLVLTVKVRTRVKVPWLPEVPVRITEPYTLEKPS